MARAMMDEANVPPILWPNSAKNPYELWKGKPTWVNHYKVFGRKVFIKRNEKHLKNFDSLFYVGILLGYSARSRRHKTYNKLTNMVEDCIDVVVHEIASQLQSSKGNMNSDEE